MMGRQRLPPTRPLATTRSAIGLTVLPFTGSWLIQTRIADGIDLAARLLVGEQLQTPYRHILAPDQAMPLLPWLRMA